MAQIAVALTFLGYYLFGLVMGWLMWGVQVDLNGPLPGYRGQVRTVTRPSARRRSPATSGRHFR